MHFKNFFILLCSLFLIRCTSVKDYLGINREMPNEYESSKHEALDMPTRSILEEPKPGIHRPQRKHTSEKTKTIVLTDIPTSKIEDVSEAEQHLLQHVGVHKKQEHIRQKVDQEANTEPSFRETIQQHILFWKKKNKGKVIDPHKEAEDLKSSATQNRPVQG